MTNSLLLTRSLTGNIHSQLTHILYVIHNEYCIVTIKPEENVEVIRKMHSQH